MVSRFAGGLAIAALIAFGLASSRCEPVAADSIPAATDGLDEYMIDCRILGDMPARAGRNGKKTNPIRMKVPTIRIQDGQTASVADTTQTALAVAEKIVDGQKVPVVRIVEEGSTVEATVIKVDEKSVVLDLRVEFQSANGSLKTQANGRESGHVVSEVRRLVEQVSLGATITAAVEGMKIEVVVARAN